MSFTALKPPSEMTAAELDAALVEGTGMPTPPPDAPKEVRRQWYVASTLILHHRHIDDPTEARERAIEELQRHSDYDEMKRYL